MSEKLKKGILCIVTFCILLTACQKVEVREQKEEELAVEIYDVIQVPENVEAYGEYQYEFHTVRQGLLYTIGAEERLHASFHSIMDGLEYRSGVKIDYFIFGSWKELRESLKNTEGNGATKIILYNNSYDESLIKEVTAGNYMDFGPIFEEEGIYEDENYQQAVLAAGRLDGKQLLVPILYNVYGMVGATTDYETAEPTYTEFLQMLQDEMNTEQEDAQISYISTAILEDRDPDLFWYAAGEEWYDYEDQKELFTQLYQYQSKYWNEAIQEMERKDTWASIIEKEDLLNQQPDASRTGTMLTSSELEALGIKNDGENKEFWNTLLSHTAYVVESGGSEENAYHSIMGLINWSMEEISRICKKNKITGEAAENDFGYWPIQMMSREGYAAQPTCCVAVMNDGDQEAAFKVIQELMKQPFALQFGFSTYTPAWREKFDSWCNTGNMQATGYYRYVRSYSEPKQWEEKQGLDATFSIGMVSELDSIDEIEALLDHQLSNIQFAQVADREVQSIWQDTLTESIQSGLTAEEGFELLCERMTEWEKE